MDEEEWAKIAISPEPKLRWWHRLGCHVPLWVIVLLMGGCVVCFYVSMSVLRPMESARRATCKSNLRQIGLAIQMYAEDNDGWFSPSFKELFPNYIDNPKVFSCPAYPSSWEDFSPGGTVTAKSSSYVYIRGLRADTPADFVLAFDKLRNHTKEKTGEPPGRNVVFADAHVEWWPARREEEFQRKLAAQREAVKKWRAAGAKVKDMGKFFGKPGAKGGE